ncbi:MAG: hypothetical protein LBV46_01020 [Bacteroidales bacterium]|jgi:antitoxin component YwqK of YwqJK toxin-antitoxin module|nr:hypothetical protein [Bacteroidales bacterium]
MNCNKWFIALMALLIMGVVGCKNKKADPDETRQGKIVEATYENGTPRVVVFYKIDEKTGKMTEEKVREVDYYDNGQKYVEGNYKAGLRDGEWKSYFKDGQIQSEVVYQNGEKEGNYTVYHENGKPYIKGQYKGGNCTGTWLFHAKTGIVANRLEAKDGVIICGQCARCAKSTTVK